MEGLPDDAKRRHISDFLQEFKELLSGGKFVVQEHVKNRQALIDLGLTYRQREDEILSLSVENYSSGPVKDEYRPGNYWVFGKEINGKEVYIKMKITKNDELAVVLSFHVSERPMKYPLS
jgi:hypothetical protein